MNFKDFKFKDVACLNFDSHNYVTIRFETKEAAAGFLNIERLLYFDGVRYPIELNEANRCFVHIKLPDSAFPKALLLYLKLKYPNAYDYEIKFKELIPPVPSASSIIYENIQSFVQRSRQKIREIGQKLKSDIARAKSTIQSTVGYKKLENKLIHFLAWFKKTDLFKRLCIIQAKLQKIKQRIETYCKAKGDLFLLKWSILQKGINYLSRQIKNYSIHAFKTPLNWLYEFTKIPSRYPLGLSCLVTAGLIGLMGGWDILGYGLLAGSGVFVVTNLRNYLYHQKYEQLQRPNSGSKKPTLNNIEQEAYENGLATQTWPGWLRSFYTDRKNWQAFLSFGAGMEAAAEKERQNTPRP